MIAQILRELIAAGLQGESLIAAVERIEQAQPKALDATAERRRAKDRERYHLRKPPKSTETADSADSAVSAPSRAPLTSLLSSLSETQTQKEVRKKERAAATSRKSALPNEWKPTEAHYAKAAKRNLPRSYVDEQAEAMRDWAASKGIMRHNWDATFNGFLRPKEIRNGYGGPRPLQDDTKSAGLAAGRLAESARRGELQFAPIPSLLPGAGEASVRLISKR